ncbi:DsbA family oxidoreductase [Actinoplanes sp. NPDC023714]|uniref:DsbA family oxidoreductase n=1 Tax=Actinoplanes sp. NPDC023714 TaxID=3154322 RepID=UPI00340F7233
MDLQVWSDVVCPWCYIGRRRLENAVKAFDGTVTITYRAYQLDPDPVPMVEKAGGPEEHAEQLFTQVASIAAGEGLTLNFDRVIAADSFAAHRLIAWAQIQDRQADMLDALQVAHFTDGVDIGAPGALAALASYIGLDGDAALEYLESGAGEAAVRTDLAAAQEFGITSVPTVVIDGKYVIQGAQETPTLLAALEEISRREAAEASA